MKTALIILSTIFLAQSVDCNPRGRSVEVNVSALNIFREAVDSHPRVHSLVVRDTSLNIIFREAVDTAIAAVRKLGNKITAAVKEGNTMLQKYSDKSTDYSSAFKINVFKELDNTIAGYNQAVTEAETIAAASNQSVAACFAAKRSAAQELVLAGGEEIVKCVVTKVKQITDLAAKLVQLGNSTVMLIPNTFTQLQNCANTPEVLQKLKCVTVTMGEAVFQLTDISVSVTSTIAAASFAYATLPSDLGLCAVSKVVGLRQRVQDLTLTIGSCVQKSID